jgi:hypothetical protein
MELELILNDLSINHPAPDRFQAQASMANFVSVLVRASRLGAKSVLRVPKSLDCHVLCPGYSLAAWRNDPTVDREKKQYFNTVVSKVSFLDGLPHVEEQLQLVEYHFNGEAAKGLGVASALDGLAVSINFSNHWNEADIELERSWIELEGDGELLTSRENVHHAACLQHLETHEQWIAERKQSRATDGCDIWQRKHNLLPGLVFCERVESELKALGATDIMLKPVYDRLRELDAYASGWTAGGFEPEELPSKVTPESQGTLENHADELTFVCPDGQKRLFSWHARMTPGAWRLHFYPDGNARRIIVGRIGRKLFA